MFQLLTVLAALGVASPLVAGPESPADSAPPGWAPDTRSAAAYARDRAGTVSFVVRTTDGVWGVKGRRDFDSASVVKAMLLVAYLDRPEVARRPLTRRDRALLGPMIRRSDNAAATAVYEQVGRRGLRRLARRAGMRAFRVGATWGRSRINAADQTRYLLRLPELLPRRHGEYALALLNSITPQQRWGVGEARPDGWRLYFKGGWGAPEGGVHHQVTLLRRGGQRVSMAILSQGGPSYPYSRQTLEGVARRLVRGLGHAVPVSPRAKPLPRPAPPPVHSGAPDPFPAPKTSWLRRN